MIKITKWNDKFRLTIEETLEFASREELEKTLKTMFDLKIKYEPIREKK